VCRLRLKGGLSVMNIRERFKYIISKENQNRIVTESETEKKAIADDYDKES
jgi:hypothetical protein